MANLYKLVNVLRVDDITEEPSIERNLVLIKVAVGAERRPEVMQICEVFRARVVDVAPASLILEATGPKDKIEGLAAVLEPYGIVEMVQTGSVAMQRGPAHAELVPSDRAPRATTSSAPPPRPPAEGNSAAGRAA